jgi:hypothetical protein
MNGGMCNIIHTTPYLGIPLDSGKKKRRRRRNSHLFQPPRAD